MSDKNSETLRHAVADLRTRNDDHAKALGIDELAIILDKSVEDLKEAARQVIRAESLDERSKVKYATRLHIASQAFVTAEDNVDNRSRSHSKWKKHEVVQTQSGVWTEVKKNGVR